MSRHPTPAERDERVSIPLPPEEALRGLLAVKPDVDECPACGTTTVATGGAHRVGEGGVWVETTQCVCGVTLTRREGQAWTVAKEQ